MSVEFMFYCMLERKFFSLYMHNVSYIFLDFPAYMFDSEHKYAIDYGTLIALSDACSAPYLSLILHWATIAWRFVS